VVEGKFPKLPHPTNQPEVGNATVMTTKRKNYTIIAKLKVMKELRMANQRLV
jgi:hypothetical protein